MNAKEINRLAALLTAKLAETRKVQADVVPKGWYSARQIAAILKCHKTTAGKRAARLKLEKRTFRVLGARGLIVATPHYNLSSLM